MIRIATPSGKVVTSKEKHVSDAKNGWYHYRTRFALPVYGRKNDQCLSEYKLYTADLLIRHDKDGKRYLYDLINIEKKNDK